MLPSAKKMPSPGSIVPLPLKNESRKATPVKVEPVASNPLSPVPGEVARPVRGCAKIGILDREVADITIEDEDPVPDVLGDRVAREA